ncbi:MAG: methionine aminotransferase [Pseudomonadales bacterium]
MLQLDTKLPGIGTTIFTVMSQLAMEYDAINLSQGFPDFPVPTPLLDLVEKYLRGGYNQYPPMAGVPYLREQIARKVGTLYATDVDMDTEITVTSGATEALFVAIQATVRHGDEVIVFDPAYDSYDPAVKLAGGRIRHIPMDPPGFRPDWQRVRETINDKTRLIIINTPHNPTGSILEASDLTALADCIAGHNIFLLSDEVYEHMVYDGKQHHSLLTHDRLRERTFVVSSFGKTCHATGWKVAYCIAPAPLTTEFRKIHQFVTFTTHTPTQWALAEFMETCPEHYLGLPDFYQAKRDTFIDAMQGSAFQMTSTEGTYFQLANYSDISRMPDTEFARFLTTRAGVAAIPISVFYAEPPDTPIVRFCFAKDDDTLKRAASKLKAVEHA